MQKLPKIMLGLAFILGALLIFNSQTSFFTALFAFSPQAEVQPSVLYSTSEHQITYHFDFDYQELDGKRLTIRIYLPTGDYYSEPVSITPSGCEWKSGVLYGERVECAIYDLDEFSVGFDIRTKEDPANIARSETWRTEIDPLGALKDTIELTVEILPPGVLVSSPANGSTVSGTIEIITAEEYGIPHYVEFYYGDTLIGRDNERNPDNTWSIQWDSSSVSNGSYELEAVACDSADNCDPQPDAVTVEVDNPVPSGAGQQQTCSIESVESPVIVGESSTISVSHSGFTAAVDTVNVSCGDGASYNNDLACSANICTFSCGDYSVDGTFTITVAISASASGETADCGSATIEVQQLQQPLLENNPPSAEILEPLSGESFSVGESVDFLGDGSDPDGDPISFEWDFGDGGGGTGKNVSHSYSSGGDYRITLIVVDDKGASDIASVNISIEPIKVNNPPVIKEIKAEPSTQNEGQPISFRVIASDEDNDALIYRWDFGDGKTGTGSAVEHGYYLPPGETERAFTVRATVSDGAAEDTGSIKVIIKKSYFTIRVLNPHSEPETPIEKGEEIAVELHITDADGTPLTGLKPEAKIEGIPIQLSEEGNGIYSGKFDVPFQFPNTAILSTKAKAHVAGQERQTSTATTVYFKPAELSITNSFEGNKYFLGERIERTTVRLTYPDKTAVSEATVKGEFSCIRGEFDFNKENDYFSAFVDLEIKENHVGCTLAIEAGDLFGNRGRETFPLPINLSNPEFNLVLLKPDLAKGNLFGYGQPLEFQVSIESNKKERLKDVKISLLPIGENKLITFLFDEEKQYFTALFRMPPRESNKQQISFNIEGAATLNGRKLFDLETIDLLLTDEIDIEFKYPSEGATALNPAYGNTLIVALTYPNGATIKDETVNAVLDDEGEEQHIILGKNIQTGLFEAPLSKELRMGKYVLTLKLAEEAGGSKKSIVVNIFQPFNWWLIVYLILGLFFLFSFTYFIRKTLKERAEKIERLKTERENLFGLMKRLRYEYFKRHITEEEYKKRLLEAQQKLATVEKRLKEKQLKPKGGAEPIKGFSRKEAGQIRRLVKKLKDYTSKYKKEEIYIAIIQDGYSPKIAGEVIKRLYEKK